MLQQVSSTVDLRPPPQTVMDYFSTPALLTRAYGVTYKIAGVTDRPLQVGDELREYWRLPRRLWDMPPGTSSEVDGQVLVGAAWTCVERVDHTAYRIEGRYLADGVGDPVGQPYTAINYFFFPSATGGTTLIRLWVSDAATDPTFNSSYVAALEQVKKILDARPTKERP